MSNYTRVIPRDLFNEAKLLNCMGKLAIAIENSKNLKLEYIDEENNNGFNILQDESDGSIYVANMNLINKKTNARLYMSCLLNSKDKYPLWDLGYDVKVLDDEGNLTDEFKAAYY